MAEAKENPADYGTPKYQGPLEKLPEQPLKKDVKAGKVITSETDPVKTTSTQTPDPNVTSIGDTTDTLTSGTNTGRTNVTRSTSNSGDNTTTSGSGSSS